MTTPRKKGGRAAPKRAGRPRSQQSATEARINGSSASEDVVAALAHRLFLERGGIHGHDVDDWLEAERQLRNGDR